VITRGDRYRHKMIKQLYLVDSVDRKNDIVHLRGERNELVSVRKSDFLDNYEKVK
jgi:hypothetical protein